MGLIDYMRNKIRSFLRVDGTNNTPITIEQKLDFYANSVKNRIWYRGDSAELAQLYGQLDVPVTMFWKASCTKGMEIRKIHTGIPKIIVKVLTNIVINDYNGVEIDKPVLNEAWESIAKENKADKLVKKLIKNMLIVGDGAFKVTFDKSISAENPIIEFIPGEFVEFTRKRGRITEVVFITEYTHNFKKYVFKEYYGYGYIKYALETENGEKLPNNFIPQTSWIKEEGVTWDDKTIMLAVPVIYEESEQYEGRGEGIFDGKTDNFDALDEVWSQWMDALRSGRSKEYIPENLIPRDPDTGRTIFESNSFDNRFIVTAGDMSENGGNKISIEQPNIPHDSYLATYITALDLCLQGLISPSTLGIDVKKLDNAEAQREKEKATLYTRGNIIEVLNEVIPALVTAAVCGSQIWHNANIDKPEVTVKFGEYANPSFESQVETVGKGRTQGIMSVEASVEELYGDSKGKDWKAEEVARLKNEQGIATLTEGAVNEDLEVVGVEGENSKQILADDKGRIPKALGDSE